MNVKSIMFSILFLIAVSLTINSVSAYEDGNLDDADDWDDKYVLKKTDTKYKGYTKKQGTYYKKYQEIKYYGLIYDGDEEDWDAKLGSFYYVKAKKGDVLKNGTKKYYKTTESKWKVYKHYKFKKIVATSSKNIKSVQGTSKKVVAHYKTIKVPKLKSGKSIYYKIGNNWVNIEKNKQLYEAYAEYGPIKIANGKKWVSGSTWNRYRYYFLERGTNKPLHPGKIKVYVKSS